ncbi:MAG: trehalose-phosphatase [Sphaerobacter sp.]|nr:trehalose-phosphatase [Sphaerobacter sp.]
MTPPAIHPVDLAVAVLATRPAGLMTDIDGTISRITSPPEAATVEPAARAALERLAGVLDVVAVISGRAVRAARRMVDVPGLAYVGNHGLERWYEGRVSHSLAAAAFRQQMGAVAQAIAAAVDHPGVQVEDKWLTLSVHFREAQDPVIAEQQIEAALLPLAAEHGLVVRPGRMVYEVRPPLAINKGTALRDLVEEHGLRAVVFLGDDVTDLDAMAALRQLGSVAGVKGLSVGVIGPETPAAIPQQADVTVEGVDGVIAFLTALADRLNAG